MCWGPEVGLQSHVVEIPKNKDGLERFGLRLSRDRGAMWTDDEIRASRVRFWVDANPISR